MSNKEAAIEIVKFSKKSGIYTRKITEEIDISEDEKNEFWDLIKENKEKILDILKDADTLPYARDNRAKSQEDKIKVYLGNFKLIAKRQPRTFKLVWVWNSNVRILDRIYGLNLLKDIEESISGRDNENQGINRSDDFISKLISSQKR
ncbi:MAG: hypothetical protein FWH29_08250 [Methanobrevibacter sp.]|nr:hypothetical protein [Methanobrevibacter sp.]